MTFKLRDDVDEWKFLNVKISTSEMKTPINRSLFLDWTNEVFYIKYSTNKLWQRMNRFLNISRSGKKNQWQNYRFTYHMYSYSTMWWQRYLFGRCDKWIVFGGRNRGQLDIYILLYICEANRRSKNINDWHHKHINFYALRAAVNTNII